MDLAAKVKRSDAIQSFQCQETPMVRITDSDGVTGTGYSYTIGTGGSSVIKLLDDHLVPSCSSARPMTSSGFGATFSFTFTRQPWARSRR